MSPNRILDTNLFSMLTLTFLNMFFSPVWRQQVRGIIIHGSGCVKSCVRHVQSRAPLLPYLFMLSMMLHRVGVAVNKAQGIGWECLLRLFFGVSASA